MGFRLMATSSSVAALSDTAMAPDVVEVAETMAVQGPRLSSELTCIFLFNPIIILRYTIAILGMAWEHILATT